MFCLLSKISKSFNIRSKQVLKIIFNAVLLFFHLKYRPVQEGSSGKTCSLPPPNKKRIINITDKKSLGKQV